MTTMNRQQAVEVLAAHQQWRRGGDGPQTDPKALGEALDLAIAALRTESVPALEVFRIAGGDVECNPNPTADQALECLRDLRECYDEALRDEAGEGVALESSDIAFLERVIKTWRTVAEPDSEVADAEPDHGIIFAADDLERALQVIREKTRPAPQSEGGVTEAAQAAVLADREYEDARKDWDYITNVDHSEIADARWEQVSSRFENALMARINAINTLEAALSAQPAEQPAVPEGFVPVPVEPTEEIINAMRAEKLKRLNRLAAGKDNEGGVVQACREDYAAILSAATKEKA